GGDETIGVIVQEAKPVLAFRYSAQLPPPSQIPASELQSNLVNATDHPPNAFIRTLPKAELHLHLEGAIELATLQELRERHGDHATAAEAEQLYLYQDFPGFLLAFKNITEHLRTPEDYELITYRLMDR